MKTLFGVHAQVSFCYFGQEIHETYKNIGFFLLFWVRNSRNIQKHWVFFGFFGFWQKKIKVIEPVIEQVIDDFEFFFVKTQKTKKTQCFCMFREFRTQKSQKCVICNRLHRSTIEYVPCNRVRAL